MSVKVNDKLFDLEFDVTKVAPGDQVLRFGIDFGKELRKIVRITPTGQVVLDDGSRFNSDGSERVKYDWRYARPSHIVIPTAEFLEEMSKDLTPEPQQIDERRMEAMDRRYQELEGGLKAVVMNNNMSSKDYEQFVRRTRTLYGLSTDRSVEVRDGMMKIEMGSAMDLMDAMYFAPYVEAELLNIVFYREDQER